MPEARLKKTFTALAGAVVAAALVVAPLVTAGASATTPPLEGVLGDVQPWSQPTNHVEYWQTVYKAQGAVCFKGERTGSNVTVSKSGLSVTLGALPAGQTWVALIVKAGNVSNNVITNPQVGVAYASPVNAGGNQAVVSHYIACIGTVPTEVKPPKPEPISSSTSNTTLDCQTSFATTTTTTTITDWVWDASAKKWVAATPVVKTATTQRALTDAEKETCAPPTTPSTTVTYGDWEGDWTCGDTTVTETRTVTTTVGDEKPTVTIDSRTRDLTHEQIGTCPLTPGTIASQCVGDVPYLSYDVALPNGFVPTEPDPTKPLTITFINKSGANKVVSGLPLSGKILWPGASATAPLMWPGWELQNGSYVKTTGNYDWTRQGVTVRFDVNPTYSQTVTYPEATAACANPPVKTVEEPLATPTPTPTDPTPTPTDPTAAPAATGDLATTGGTGVSPIAVIGGAAALALGVGIVVFTGIRRRRTGAE